MPVTLKPQIAADLTFVPLADDFQISPPVAWHTLASQWNAESGSQVTGRYHRHSGDVESVGVPKPQDTYLQGTAGRTGRALDVVSGTVKDDWVHAETTKYGLLFPDGTGGASFEVVDHTAGTKLTHQLIVMRIGAPPPSSNPTAATRYFYLELAYQDPNSNYRIALEFGQPIRIDYQDITTNHAWAPLAIAEKLGSLETYLAAHNGELRIRIKPDEAQRFVSFEVGNGNWLRHSPDRPFNPNNPNASPVLPSSEKYRIQGKNMWCSFCAYPLRYAPATVKQKGKKFPSIPNLGDAQVAVSTIGGQASGQVNATSVAQDGDGKLSHSTTATPPDAGDGLGGATPARISDVLVYKPAVWSTFMPIGGYLPEVRLRAKHVVEHQVWDDMNRIGRTWGTIRADNTSGAYNNGTFSHYALNLMLGNGSSIGQRCRGIAGYGPGGIRLRHMDPIHDVEIPYSDFWCKMERQLGQTLTPDGFAFSSTCWILAEIGQISPKFLALIPNDGLPPYPDSYPGFILPKGTGTNPKYELPPERTVRSCFVELLQDSGSVDALGRSTPYFASWTPWGEFNVAPYNPGLFWQVKSYWNVDPTGAGQVMDEPVVIENSIENVRTAVTLQGQDAFSYELLQWHEELWWNYWIVGWQWPLLERNSRYSSESYMARIAQTLRVQASLGTQTVAIKVPFDPFVFAGNLVSYEGYLYTIIAMTSRVGYLDDGSGECASWLMLRSLQNSLVY